MIIGTGIDAIEVERVKEKLNKGSGFREKVFSVSEIEYCEMRKANKYQHYAVRFAAKEAFLKAMGYGLGLTHELHEIEILVDESGKPSLHVSTNIQKKIKATFNAVHVSMAHLQTIAFAMVIVEN